MKEDNEEPEEVVLKTSRISFLSNYIIAFFAIIFLVLLINAFSMKFSFLPKTKGELISTLEILGLLAIIAMLIEQPEMIRLRRSYIVTRDEVIEIDGVLTKKKVILPYQSISEVTVRKGLIGRMLNYGDIFIGAVRTGSDINMKGIREAHKIHKLIQDRISLLRKGQLEFFEKRKGKKEITED